VARFGGLLASLTAELDAGRRQPFFPAGWLMVPTDTTSTGPRRRTVVGLATALALSIGVTAFADPIAIGPGRPGFDPDRTAVLAGVLSFPEVVYDNLATPLGNYLGGFAYEEVGDDVTLAGTSRILGSVTVAYAGFNFDGDETLTLTLYLMNGPPTPASFGFNTPGTVLFSATVPILSTIGSTITFLDASGSVVLPDVVGVGVSFAGVDFDPTGAGSDAGPLLYDPPAVGSSLDDFWLRGFPNPGDPWGLYTFGGSPPINLGLQITTVPEPATMFLLGAGMMGVGVTARRRRQGARQIRPKS
jgi:hypothetical protein